MLSTSRMSGAPSSMWKLLCTQHTLKCIFGLSPPLGPGTVTRPAPERDPDESDCGSHAPAHTPCCSEPSRVDPVLLGAEPCGPRAARSRAVWTPCCSEPSRVDPVLLGAEPCGPRAARSRAVWTPCCSEPSRVDPVLLGAEPCGPRAARSRAVWTPCCSEPSRVDPVLLGSRACGPRAARSRAVWTPCCSEPSRPRRLPRVSSWAGSYPRRQRKKLITWVGERGTGMKFFLFIR
ncbi:PREDICTED: uncharacterized protein LOC106726927 [Myotis brandtii]|uniref:uncharacterized protein LOC106726927 n=1 Tax=Myotis brandtii TaxID=109478 RepID=UPI0007042027|nr:PREDICTED: uncharacterized protein LOC106726927 [Myotis brandtii]